MLLPALSKARAAAQAIKCTSNLKQLGLNFKLFGNDHNGAMPACHLNPDDTAGANGLPPIGGYVWADALVKMNYLNSIPEVTCPSDPETAALDNPSYGMSSFFKQSQFPSENGGVAYGGGALSYDYVREDTISNPTETIVLADAAFCFMLKKPITDAFWNPEARHNSSRANVLWADGHADAQKQDIACRKVNEKEYYYSLIQK